MRVRKSLLVGMGAVALITSVTNGPAAARRDVGAYLEVREILDAERAGGTEVLTYSEVSVGGDVAVEGPRMQGRAAYQYERRIGSSRNVRDSNSHNGLARGTYRVSEDVKVDASALTTRARNDLRNGIGSRNSSDQVSSLSVGPTVQTRIGSIDLNASYHLGYVNVDDPGEVTAAGKVSPVNRYDQSLNHEATVSVGMRPGNLPFGWTISGSYDREDTNFLDQRSVNSDVRAEVLVPVSSTIALTGSVGYENIEVGQRAPLLDSAGAPLVSSKGRYVVNPASPRLLSYDYQGLSYDAGFSWKPNPRLALAMSYGKSDGKTALNGSLSYKLSPHMALRASVYNGLDSFGRSLNNGLGSIPNNFGSGSNPFANDFGGCSFAKRGAGGACLGDALSSISPFTSYTRRASLAINGERGRWRGGLGVGLSRRKYLVPASLDPFGRYRGSQNDYWAEANLARQMGDNGTISTGVYAGTSTPIFGGAFRQNNFGGSLSYNRAITQRLSGVTSLGYNMSHQKDGDTYSTASALVGMRYNF
jgi:hypothetical protein